MNEAPNPAIEGRAELVGAWRQLLLTASESGARELVCVDADFVDWPLDEPAVIDALQRWARPHGRVFRMLASDFEPVARRCPRFAAWRRDWAHRFQARCPGADDRIELPSLLLAGAQAVEVLDRERWRARHVTAPADLRALYEQCEAIAQRCEPAWPATTLGL